ncbi:MAG: hypothetical protein ACREQO_18220 [Candidatus Binatia bacterium]
MSCLHVGYCYYGNALPNCISINFSASLAGGAIVDHLCGERFRIDAIDRIELQQQRHDAGIDPRYALV